MALTDQQRDDVRRGSQCTNKKKLSKAAAIRKKDHMHTKTLEPFKAYWCCYCGGWHVGHVKGWKPIDREMDIL